MDNGTLRFISKEKAIERLREIHFSESGVCKVVGLNILVRQFGLGFHCNGIKQLAKDLLKAVMAKSGHSKWSLFMTNNRGQYPSPTLFSTHHVRGKQHTVFLTSR